MRLSELERRRTGNPPASEEAINNLNEVDVDAVFNEQTGNLDFPKCSVCFEELQGKAVQMPCGHQFTKDCICEWLK